MFRGMYRGSQGGGGTPVDYNRVIEKTKVMPSAETQPADKVYMYIGNTDSNYTQNYIYKNVKTATYTGTVSFEAATISGTTVACSGDNFANFLTESGVEPLSVVSGTMTFDAASSLWVLVGKNANNETVLTFQEYQQDFVDAGFTFTGTPQDGDVVAFTCTVAEASATYAWTRIDVQPTSGGLPDQTGQSGKFLVTNGANASWDNSVKNNILIVENETQSQYDSIQQIELRTLYNGSVGRAVKFYASTGGGFVIESTAINVVTNNGLNPGNNEQQNLGGIISKWKTIYVTKLNNGSNITIPNVAGELAVKSVNTTITLTAAGWSNGSQTVSVSGITSTGVVFVSPDPTDQADYTTAGILCTAQATDSLTFTCDTTPSSDIDVVVVQM